MDPYGNTPETQATRTLADEELTQAVLVTLEQCESERFQEVMRSLVRHLHAFVKDVQLTEDEWFTGIDFLTRTGHITDSTLATLGSVAGGMDEHVEQGRG